MMSPPTNAVRKTTMRLDRFRNPVAAVILVGMIAPSITATEPALQRSAQRGVTIVVTPQAVTRDEPAWDVKVVLDTHSQDLSDDLTKSTALIDGTGKRYVPIAWEGAPPGGHRREGVLRFAPIKPAPASLELGIERAGESESRSFRWQSP
jgi:hypothetical protein